MKTAIILGAGFSKNSGLPVQSEIPAQLISDNKEAEVEQVFTKILKKFLKNVYGSSDSSNLPNLDDIFTCIDISTNSGHHLGMKYSPLHLRMIRRILVYRVFSILEGYFRPSDDIKTLIGLLHQKFLRNNYVVLNWDTLLEKYLLSMYPGIGIDYCNEGLPWQSGKDGAGNQIIKIMKIHGSSNWLYCDNCRTLFYDLYDSIPLYKKAGFKRTDLELFEDFRGVKNAERLLTGNRCNLCGNIVSSHIATFSYRKTFRMNSFPSIWNEAEKALSHSDKWIFIGYSLPDADYEFKHLLKISELKFAHTRKNRLTIDLVLLNSKNTILKYKNFFGDALSFICNGGIKEYNEYLRNL